MHNCCRFKVFAGKQRMYMKLEKEFIENQAFSVTALSMDAKNEDPQAPAGVNTGVFPQENGDVVIRLFFPNAKKVSLHAGVSRQVAADVELTELGNGVFEGVLPYDERLTGPANVQVTADGVNVLCPDLPIIWGGSRPANNIEIPDPEAGYLLIRDVPHGAYTREIFKSDVLDRFERCMIYTPPGYQKTKEPYPVLYLQHGGGDNELMWEYVGHISTIMDNLIADGKAVPFVIVMCNAMLRKGGKIGFPIDLVYDEMLTSEVIPFIEKTYNVRTDRKGRAIAGLSMGSFMTSDIAFRHPELFCALGNFTAGMTSGDMQIAYEKPHISFMKNGRELAEKYFDLYWRSTTPQEDHLEYFEADDEILKEAGIDTLPCYHRVLYPPRTAKWNSWRMGIRDMAQLLFREKN